MFLILPIPEVLLNFPEFCYVLTQFKINFAGIRRVLPEFIDWLNFDNFPVIWRIFRGLQPTPDGRRRTDDAGQSPENCSPIRGQLRALALSVRRVGGRRSRRAAELPVSSARWQPTPPDSVVSDSFETWNVYRISSSFFRATRLRYNLEKTRRNINWKLHIPTK